MFAARTVLTHQEAVRVVEGRDGDGDLKLAREVALLQHRLVLEVDRT